VTLGLRALIPGAHKNGPPSTNHVKIGMMAGASAGGREVDCHRLVITARGSSSGSDADWWWR
jgi:hypothetical protein